MAFRRQSLATAGADLQVKFGILVSGERDGKANGFDEVTGYRPSAREPIIGWLARRWRMVQWVSTKGERCAGRRDDFTQSVAITQDGKRWSLGPGRAPGLTVCGSGAPWLVFLPETSARHGFEASRGLSLQGAPILQAASSAAD